MGLDGRGDVRVAVNKIGYDPGSLRNGTIPLLVDGFGGRAISGYQRLNFHPEDQVQSVCNGGRRSKRNLQT